MLKVNLALGMNYDAVVNGHQYWRMFTAALSHASLMHIVFNTCSVIVAGMYMESELGTLAYAAINLWILLIASSLTLLS